MRRLGYIRDRKKAEEEKQDLLFLNSFPHSSAKAPDLRHLIVDVLQQGEIGSCVANAGFQAIRMRHFAEGVRDPKLGARLWGYYLARAYISLTKVDSGSQIRDFFRALNKFGFLTEEEYGFHYDTKSFNKSPSREDYSRAFDQKDKGDVLYYRIQEGPACINAIKVALHQGFPVVFGAYVSTDFVNYSRGDHIWEPHKLTDIAGGHAMCMVAADVRKHDVFTAVGSWGKEAHDNGFHHFSADFMAKFATDLWVVKQVPHYSSSK